MSLPGAALAEEASDPYTAVISGGVTFPAGDPPIEMNVTLYKESDGRLLYLRSTPAPDGRYRFAGLSAGTYGVRVACVSPCAAPYLTEWWNDGRDENTADRIGLAAAEARSDIDLAVSTGSSVSGTVTGFHDVRLPGVTVDLRRLTSSGYTSAASTLTDAEGEYRFHGLWDDDYTLRFTPPMQDPHLLQWWEGSPGTTQSKTFAVPKDTAVANMDIRLTKGASVSGTVVGSDGTPVDTYVGLFTTASWSERVAQGWTDATGRFHLRGVLAGTYTLGFNGQVRTGHLGEFWDDRPDEVATVFAVAEGEDLTGFDVELSTEAVPVELPPLPRDVTVGDTIRADASSTAPDARLEYQWYRNGGAIPGATASHLTVGPELEGKRLTVRVVASAPGFSPIAVRSSETFGVRPMPPPTPPWGDVVRWSGADRYATSVEVSKRMFPDGADGIYIANGTNFPDALSGAVLTGQRGGPLLLTPATGLPHVVIDEIKRLRPTSVVIFGGTNAVSARVASQLEALTNYHVPARFAGADRYATSVAISRAEFGSDQRVVYIANGANFPDALSGAPVAGHFSEDGGPLLLSPANAIPKVIADELKRLQPRRIVILGGTASISEEVAVQLQSYTSGQVTRVAGPDRYSTSAAVSEANFDPEVPVAFIANGTKFPDALSGAPSAAILGAPVLLTATDSLPNAVVAELKRLRPKEIVILGGTSSVSTAVRAALEALG
ncbi:cell wall-binding repeat-containing protein [Agromyces luteolus]|uniref:alpha-amylase n=1 Tax=Agromyces luteolus TaxID=88373 RepID=A0A7C9HRC0_9MICO|nr:cell wall-binding repeat-containing protein [Agromyces luteolus]MUN07569.1 hypothetical protein [Agromyces luteolus]